MPRQVDDGYEVPSLQPATAAQAHAWLCQRVGEPWQMLEEWLVFGKESGNRFDFILNEDGSAEVSARIDARSDPAEFIHGVCELSCLADACFIQQN